MIKYLLIATCCILTSTGLAQDQQEVDIRLDSLKEVRLSRNITTTSSAQYLVNMGDKILPILAASFSDSSATTIYSDCQEIYLTKGEIAIIIADQIEGMPYFHLTNIQNCLAEFCPDNPNRIEYYFRAIRTLGASDFQERYMGWLQGKGSKKNKRVKRRQWRNG